MPYHGLATRKTVEVKVAATLTKRPDGTIDQKSKFKTISQARWTGEVRFVPEHLADPIRWLKPRRIFVNSMADLFHEKLTNEQIAAVFGVMATAPQHTFQILTKRAKRMREWFEWLIDRANGCIREALAFCLTEAAKIFADNGIKIPRGEKPTADAPIATWPLPNVWMGVSVENQEAADERIPELLATPAAVRFLSCEPLIGRVSIAKWLRGDGKPGSKDSPGHASVSSSVGGGHVQPGASQEAGNVAESQVGSGGPVAPTTHPLLSWVIAGCESGPGMRPCEPNWLRTLRDECRVGNVKYFLKQATAAQEGGHRLYPSGQAARSEVRFVVKAGDGSTTKPGGVIGLPYLDDKQHTDLPA